MSVRVETSEIVSSPFEFFSQSETVTSEMFPEASVRIYTVSSFPGSPSDLPKEVEVRAVSSFSLSVTADAVVFVSLAAFAAEPQPTRPKATMAARVRAPVFFHIAFVFILFLPSSQKAVVAEKYSHLHLEFHACAFSSFSFSFLFRSYSLAAAHPAVVRTMTGSRSI